MYLRIKSCILKLAAGQNLEKDEIEAVVEEIIAGKASDAQIAAFLTALQIKGITPFELAIFAQTLQRDMPQYEIGKMPLVVASTGGDVVGLFNITTAASFIAAGAGATVIKHMYMRSGRARGSAETLHVLGVNFNVTIEDMKKIVEKIGIGFTFMPLHLKVLHALQSKMQLGLRTAVDLVGPLITPIANSYRYIGVYSREAADIITKSLQLLNVKRALVVCGLNGIDAFSTLGKTACYELGATLIQSRVYVPETFGFKQIDVKELMGGSAEENAKILKSILNGEEKGAKADIAILNAAAMLYAANIAESINEGVELAKESVESGRAAEKLELLIKETQRIALERVKKTLEEFKKGITSEQNE